MAVTSNISEFVFIDRLLGVLAHDNRESKNSFKFNVNKINYMAGSATTQQETF